MKSNHEGCRPPQLSNRSTIFTVDRLSSSLSDSTYRWSTSRDLDEILMKRADASGSVWAKLHRDREKLRDMGYRHLRHSPGELRNGDSQTGGSPAYTGLRVKRWVALPRRLPPIGKKVQLTRPAPRRRPCGGAPLSERAGRTSGVSTTDSDALEYRTARENSSTAASSIGPPGIGLPGIGLPGVGLPGVGLPGITSVPFKCPALSPARKTAPSVSSSLDSQTALRKAMRSQIERQRKFVLSKHVEFVSCNEVNGTRLRNPRGHAARNMVGCFSSSHEVNIELMAILSVQEFNKPRMSKEVFPDAPIK